MFEIVFSNRANETFDAIEAQLIERWGIDIAIDFELRTLKILETISVAPFLYQAVNANSEVRRVVIHKNCSLFYKVSGQIVVLLFFWDNRQEPLFF